MEPIVYIVDDDSDVRDAIAELVGLAGFNVETYASAEEFLAAIDQERPCPGCLVADLGLPGLSGAQLWAYLVKQSIHLPTIITSGSFAPSVLDLWNREDVDLLPKPFDPTDLLDRIRQALARVE